MAHQTHKLEIYYTFGRIISVHVCPPAKWFHHTTECICSDRKLRFPCFKPLSTSAILWTKLIFYDISPTELTVVKRCLCYLLLFIFKRKKKEKIWWSVFVIINVGWSEVNSIETFRKCQEENGNVLVVYSIIKPLAGIFWKEIRIFPLWFDCEISGLVSFPDGGNGRIIFKREFSGWAKPRFVGILCPRRI